MWVLEPIEGRAFLAKHGKQLESTTNLDPYEFACVIQDVGDGVALICNASGEAPARKDLGEKLKRFGFNRVRWVRVVERKL